MNLLKRGKGASIFAFAILVLIAGFLPISSAFAFTQGKWCGSTSEDKCAGFTVTGDEVCNPQFGICFPDRGFCITQTVFGCYAIDENDAFTFETSFSVPRPLPPGGVYVGEITVTGTFVDDSTCTGDISAAFRGNDYFQTWEAKPACAGDFEADTDVDGTDLAVFAADFGRTDCAGDCEGDFDEDGDVDGSDLATFAGDFGRTDCPICCK